VRFTCQSNSAITATWCGTSLRKSHAQTTPTHRSDPPFLTRSGFPLGMDTS
jgi:hypothetical protein